MERIPETRVEAIKRFVHSWVKCNIPKLNLSPEANPDVNLTAVAGEISARWKSLSKEDQIAITTGSMQEIEEEREVRDLAQHNVPLKAFHDARSTVQAVEKEVHSVSLDC